MLRYFLTAAALNLLALTLTAPTTCPTVQANNTHYTGIDTGDGVEAFLGIPYAEPPIGNLRFMPTKLLNTSTEARVDRDATKFGPVCYQVHNLSPIGGKNLRETSGEDEDCLTVNIWRPTTTESKAPLPVMIWIYGGNYGEGGGSVPIYNLENFVRQNPSIIAVTLNYRVGIFGFPHGPVRGGNLGFLDQRLAIEWIRDNIEGFGGDPERMILFGESAGSVSSHVYSYAYQDDPIVKGLILQSGVATGVGDGSPALWHLAANNAGCPTADPNAEIDCMMQKDAETIIRGVTNLTVNPIGVSNGGSPFVDNVTVFSIPEYTRRLEAGEFAKLPILLGNNNNEGEGVINFTPQRGLNKTLADDVTITLFTCSVSTVAAGLHNLSIPVWRYRYMPVFPSLTFYPFLHTYHISEVPIVLGTYDKLQPKIAASEAQIEASKLMQKAWVTFAHDPACGLSKELNWPQYDPKAPTLVRLFENSTANVDFVDPNIYETQCANPPPFSYTQLGAPPP